MKSYLISFDHNVTDINRAHYAITSLPGSEWWHYLNGTYIIISNQTAYQLRQGLITGWPGGWFLIIEVKRSSDGLLPQVAWDWINEKVQ